MMTLVLVPFENKVCFEVIRGEFYGFFIIKQLKKPWLCSVHLGSGQSTQEVGRNTRLRLLFPPTLLSCSGCFLHALQQNRAHSRLLYLSIKNCLIMPVAFPNIIYGPKLP